MKQFFLFTFLLSLLILSGCGKSEDELKKLFAGQWKLPDLERIYFTIAPDGTGIEGNRLINWKIEGDSLIVEVLKPGDSAIEYRYSRKIKSIDENKAVFYEQDGSEFILLRYKN